MVVLVFVSAGITVFNMLTMVYKDTSIQGTVKHLNGSHVTLSDDRIFESPVFELDTYCKPNQHIRIEPGSPNIVWCNGNQLSVNALHNLISVSPTG